MNNDAVLEKDTGNAKSAKLLVDIANKVVAEYWKGGGFYVGRVIMNLNNNHEGEVWITYMDDSSDVSPNVINVIFNTTNKKLVKIDYLGADSKLAEGRLLIEQWKFDSDEVHQIAWNIFNEKGEFESAYINTSYVRDCWIVTFSKDNVSYYAEIDPYTGKVITSGEEKIK
jgi:hypothetical protein